MRQKHPTHPSGSKNESRTAVVQELINLDYPREDETITGSDYTFRIKAPQEAQEVEVCINQGPWMSCRESGGYWWYDWTGIGPGPYQARARMRQTGGKVQLTLLRRFQAK